MKPIIIIKYFIQVFKEFFDGWLEDKRSAVNDAVHRRHEQQRQQQRATDLEGLACENLCAPPLSFIFCLLFFCLYAASLAFLILSFLNLKFHSFILQCGAPVIETSTNCCGKSTSARRHSLKPMRRTIAMYSTRNPAFLVMSRVDILVHVYSSSPHRPLILCNSCSVAPERMRPRDAHVALRPHARLADGRHARTRRRRAPLPRARRPARRLRPLLAKVMSS